jgi:hypothetical protein
MTATLKAIKDGLRRRWHYSIPEQGKWLRRVVQGYLNYHSVPNFPTMQKFRTRNKPLARALRRRSQKMINLDNKQTAGMATRVRVLHLACGAVHRQTQAGARCVNRARRDLCGGIR